MIRKWNDRAERLTMIELTQNENKENYFPQPRTGKRENIMTPFFRKLQTSVQNLTPK